VADFRGDPLDRGRVAFEHLPGCRDPERLEVGAGKLAGGRLEAADQGARAHAALAGEALGGDGAVEVPLEVRLGPLDEVVGVGPRKGRHGVARLGQDRGPRADRGEQGAPRMGPRRQAIGRGSAALPSNASRPAAERTTRSARPRSSSTWPGASVRPATPATGWPSSVAARTRKRGRSGSPCIWFHSTPAEWKISIGAMAVDRKLPRIRRTMTSRGRGSASGLDRAFMVLHLPQRASRRPTRAPRVARRAELSALQAGTQEDAALGPPLVAGPAKGIPVEGQRPGGVGGREVEPAERPDGVPRGPFGREAPRLRGRAAREGQATAVIGSMTPLTWVTLLAGKPLSRACSWTASSLSAR